MLALADPPRMDWAGGRAAAGRSLGSGRVRVTGVQIRAEAWEVVDAAVFWMHFVEPGDWRRMGHECHRKKGTETMVILKAKASKPLPLGTPGPRQPLCGELSGSHVPAESRPVRSHRSHCPERTGSAPVTVRGGPTQGTSFPVDLP